MLRLSFTAAVVLSSIFALGCDEACNVYAGPCKPSCPEILLHGERCEWPNQQCVPEESKCAEIEEKQTTCKCTNQEGGFRWDCKVKQCSCTCPCGILTTASCDSVNCAEPEDECPPEAAQFCEIHCGDAGVTDGGEDGDARSDAATDLITDLFDAAEDTIADISDSTVE